MMASRPKYNSQRMGIKLVRTRTVPIGTQFGPNTKKPGIIASPLTQCDPVEGVIPSFYATGVVVHVVTAYGTRRMNSTKMMRNTTAQRVYPPNAPYMEFTLPSQS